MTRGKSFGIGVLAASIVLLASFTVQASDQQLNDDENNGYEGSAVVQCEGNAAVLYDGFNSVRKAAGLPNKPLSEYLIEISGAYIVYLRENGIAVNSIAPEIITINGVEYRALGYTNSEGDATPDGALNFWLGRSGPYAIMAEKGPYEGSYDAVGVAIAHEYALILFA